MAYLEQFLIKLEYGKCQRHLSRLSLFGCIDVWRCRNLYVTLHLENYNQQNDE